MKYLNILISGLLFLCGLLGLVLSLLKIVKAFILIFEPEGHPGFYLVEAIDAILISVVMFILAGGIYKLFSGNQNAFKESIVFANFSTFKGLKVMLWEAILLALTVQCALGFYFNNENDFTYEKLIFPVTILLLALSLKFINKGNS